MCAKSGITPMSSLTNNELDAPAVAARRIDVDVHGTPCP